MNTPLTPDEIGDQGNALFETRIKPLISGEDPDLFLAIDINSGDYEVAPDDTTPGQHLRQRRPGAVVFLRRVGDEDAYYVGSGYRA